ncbi:MAG: flagellar export chaperone FlgN [Clostridia bacterium]|nr:flagellar export chaperone FlgN [Clostridia bacterium]
MRGNLLNLVFKRMAGGYQEQLPFYEKMLHVAEQQKVVLAKEEVDMEQIFNLIEQRQELIVTLEKMNEGLASLKEEIKDALEIAEFNISNIKAKISGPGVEALANSLEQLGYLVTEIKELDQVNETALRQVMQKTQEQLKILQENKKAGQAYQSTLFTEEGVFIDYSK